MINDILKRVCDCILKNNQYFCKGYCNVYQDVNTFQILTSENNEYKVVFPNDSLGDYFFLRNTGEINFEANVIDRISDCSDSGYDSRISVTLIAIMDDADPDTLLTNLISTIQNCGNFRTTLLSASTNMSNIISLQLKGMNKSDIDATLQRMKQTIVSVTFNIVDAIQLINPSCIQNPCKSC